MVPVVVAETPILGEAEDDEPAAAVLHRGDLVFADKDQNPLKWHATMDGAPATREGMTFLLRPTSGTGNGYGFKHEFGPAIRVPTARWLCAKAEASTGKLPGCEHALVRARTSAGAVVAWALHGTRPGPLLTYHHGALRALVVDPVTRGRVVEVAGVPYALLETRSASADGKYSGGRLVPVRLGDAGLARLAPIVTDEIDARDEQKVTSRAVKVTLEAGAVRVVGTRRVVLRADGAEVETAAIDELVPLANRTP